MKISVVRGTQMLSSTYVCKVYLRGDISAALASSAGDIFKFFSFSAKSAALPRCSARECQRTAVLPS